MPGEGGSDAQDLGGDGGGAKAGAKAQGAGGSSGTESAENAGAAALVEDRPPRPSWKPPFSLAEPGWRASTEPICIVNQGQTDAFSVWADERGVYALSAITCNPLARVPCGKQGVQLGFNSGHGWQTLYRTPPESTQDFYLQLTGFPGGSPIIYGILGEVYGLYLVNDGALELARAFEAGTTSGVFVVDAELAYVMDERKLLEYSEGRFREIAELPERGNALWANRETVVVVGDNQSFYVREEPDGPFEPVRDAPAGNYVSIWGTESDDLWAGNGIGQIIHYDGQDWHMIEAGGNPNDPAVVGFWGSGGSLYFRTRYDFGRVKDGQSELLIEGGDPTAPEARLEITGLWGASPTEVFLAIDDRDYRPYACGQHFVVWYDGSLFHQF